MDQLTVRVARKRREAADIVSFELVSADGSTLPPFSAGAHIDKAGNTPEQQAIARQFAADGPDKPFLDVHFYDDRRGIVVGAYGLALRTEDGGATWQWPPREAGSRSTQIR